MKRGAILSIGTVLLVIGLAGLGLLKTGVICPVESTGFLSLRETAPTVQEGESDQKLENSPTKSEQPAGNHENIVKPGRQSAFGENSSDKSGQLTAQTGERSSSDGAAEEKAVPVPQVGKGERRYPAQQPAQLAQLATQPKPDSSDEGSRVDEKRLQALVKSEPKRNAGKSEAKRNEVRTDSAGKVRGDPGRPVVIRFNFDPIRSRGMDVARVHLGDRIRVNVRSVGQVSRRVYFTFSKSINSPQGAVLELATMRSFQRPVAYMRDHGYYVIEVKIYPGNRWNIMPRSYV